MYKHTQEKQMHWKNWKEPKNHMTYCASPPRKKVKDLLIQKKKQNYIIWSDNYGEQLLIYPSDT